MSFKRILVLALLYTLLGAVVSIGGRPAWSEEHNHPAKDAAMHEQFYKTWNKPYVRDEKGKRTASCCNKQDCYATPFKEVDGNVYAQRREDKRWMLVPAKFLEENYEEDGRESPDGQSHVCMTKPYRNMAWEYGEGSETPVEPTTEPFEIATDGAIHCATRGAGL